MKLCTDDARVYLNDEAETSMILILQLKTVLHLQLEQVPNI